MRSRPVNLQSSERSSSGKSNKVIAYELGMCESTVKVHVRRIMKKLNAKNRTDVAIKSQTVLSTFPGPTLPLSCSPRNKLAVQRAFEMEVCCPKINPK